MTGKQMKKLYEDNKWELDRTRGSHHMMTKNGITVSIPIHDSKELKRFGQSPVQNSEGGWPDA